MTEPRTKDRNAALRGWTERSLLLLVLLVATGLRLNGIAAGLPAINDPDEPLFMMTALDMLRNQSFNPGWFGHPGTTTLYGLAAVMLAVAGVGIVSGRFVDAGAFATAVYADPSIVFLPARLFIVACGVACVYLTYRLGKRLNGPRLGLIAAAFLAINAVHIEYSQIVRTDVQATVFMLLCALSSIAISRDGRLRNYVLAGLFVGLACATKWPAALIALSPISAGLQRLLRGERELPRMAAFALAAVGALLVASPYLLLDHATVLRNLSGEARPLHPGATGGGILDNLVWYGASPLMSSLGMGGLLLAILGVVWGPTDQRRWAIAVLPGGAAFLLAICSQALLWERWIVPVLPFACIAAARAVSALADWLRGRLSLRPQWLEGVAVLVLAVPMLQTTRIEAVERRNDTRQIASAWVRANVPAGSSILIEHAAFDLLQGPWSFRFPLGSAGCVDAHQTLAGRIPYSQVEASRQGRPIVDMGHVDIDRLDSCRADYAIFTYYDRYLASSDRFPEERARYQRLLDRGTLRAVIRPEHGSSKGPIVYIAQLRHATT